MLADWRGINRMTEQGYAECARKFLADSDREFAAGERQQASEKLYGAASEALTAIAIQRGWKHRTHRDMKNAAQRLADEHNDLFLVAGFNTAEKFHKNFFHDEMEEYEIAADRPTVHEYVNRVLALMGERKARAG